ncbi:hypothetical protein GWK47_053499 [Chionoecetes opilio]|uniref:Uncharacterized protein n=1 Tax=Chionoecetes opilio TaxID=41210 RepID=A0A8J4Y608_CHIOP|nr:hypothetical protein GWK47_053499 [Chionoecetes opilio]
MRAMTRLNGPGATFCPSACTMCRLCAPWWIICAPVPHRALPSQQGRLEVLQNNAMRTMPGAFEMVQRLRNASETRLVPLATRVGKCIMGPSRGQSLPPDVEGVARGDSGWP